MRFSLLAIVSLFAAACGAISAVSERWDDDFGLRKICRHLPVKDGGCIRYVRGFDVTGVTTEIDLTFPQIKNKCDCIEACLQLPGICSNYVWKFSTNDSVVSGYRTCTLYSNFILPFNVTIAYDITNAADVNLEPLNPQNNPQAGALVPEAFKDINLNTTADPEAVSGPLWALSDGSFIC